MILLFIIPRITIYTLTVIVLFDGRIKRATCHGAASLVTKWVCLRMDANANELAN